MPLEMPENIVVADTEKGMPPGEPVSLAGIAAKNWSLSAGDVSFPIAVLREEALLGNARWMQRFAADQKVWLYPHGKTTMAPQIFRLQLEYGCRGMTVANPLQADICLRNGVSSVFIANQVVGHQAIERLRTLLQHHGEAEIFVIVDSGTNAVALLEALGDYCREQRLKLLIEMGVSGGRTGVRSVDEAVALAQLLDAQGVRVCGLEAFEGIFNMADFGKATAAVESLLATMQSTWQALHEQDLLSRDTCYLSAGGSAFYDLVAKRFHEMDALRPLQVIIRSGCYITHDSGMYRRAYADLLQRGLIQPSDNLEPALEVWAQVQSCPEPGRAFANAGKRDVSHDIELPVVRWWYRPDLHDKPVPVNDDISVTALNDQHAYLKFAQEFELEVGDLVGFGISHPCTTFDKWKFVYTVDRDLKITGAVQTLF